MLALSIFGVVMAELRHAIAAWMGSDEF